VTASYVNDLNPGIGDPIIDDQSIPHLVVPVYQQVSHIYDSDNVTVLSTLLSWKWTITPQPMWEYLDFTTPVQDLWIDDNPLTPEILRIEVATYCSAVPLPGSLVLCCIGVGCLALNRARNRPGSRR